MATNKSNAAVDTRDELMFSPDAGLAREFHGNVTVAQAITTEDVVDTGVESEYDYVREANVRVRKFLVPTYVEVTYMRNSADSQHNVDWTVTQVTLYGNSTDEDGVSLGRDGLMRYENLTAVRSAGLSALADWILTQSQLALPKAN